MEILDASALLAFLKKENGYQSVGKLFHDAYEQKFSVFIHQINYIEVAKKSLQYFGEAETKKALSSLEQPFFGVSNYFSDELATYTTLFLNPSAPLSLADRIGLAFTKIMAGRFWTADQALKIPAEKAKVVLQLIR